MDNIRIEPFRYKTIENEVGVLPAAGVSSRWNGTFKELLPIGENRWVIDSAIDALKKSLVSEIIIVSSPTKIQAHVEHFRKGKYKNLNIRFVIQYKPDGLLDAIKLAVNTAIDSRIYFAMPDTVISETAFGDASIKTIGYDSIYNLNLGYFYTNTPSRFGIINNIGERDGVLLTVPHYNFSTGDFINITRTTTWTVVDKPQLPDSVDKYKAWGVASWDAHFTHSLFTKNYKDLAEAFNDFNSNDCTTCGMYFLGSYTDFASWKDYSKWVKENTN